MAIRGVRGATIVDRDDRDAILSATRELLQALQVANEDMTSEDLASIIFTVTPDLRSAYPAQAAREIGWDHVPLLCAQEIPVPEGVSHCIRVLLHWNTDLPQDQVRHVYLGDAVQLRPDLSYQNPVYSGS